MRRSVDAVSARRRKQQWARRRRIAGRILVVSAPFALAAGAVRSPLLDVDAVRVEGARHITAERVVELAGIRSGTPLAAVDLGDAERRLERVPLVLDARVRRDWPSRIVVTVVERQPAIAVRRPDRLSVYSADGVELGVRATAPAALPVVDVPTGTAGADVVAAAVRVVRAMPPALRAKVARVVAVAADDVQLTLRDGALVVWGSADRSDEKARVLTLLLPRAARRYDVRSPSTPAIS